MIPVLLRTAHTEPTTAVKEHVAILIMSATGADSALAINVFASEELYYNITPNYGTAIFTLLGSQLFG